MVKMDGGGKDFSGLIALIEDIEASAQKEQSAVAIDVTDTFSPHAVDKKKTYVEMLQLLEEIEPGARKATKEAAARPEMQPHLITAGLEQAQFAQTAVPSRHEAPQEKQGPVKTLQENKDRVLKELGSLTVKLASLAPYAEEMKRRQVNVSELVLPGLSVADQISELERIIEGLKENVFDRDHMQIVADEVYGLSQVIADDRKMSKRGAAAQQGALEKSLTDLRDQKLAEAAALLKDKGV